MENLRNVFKKPIQNLKNLLSGKQLFSETFSFSNLKHVRFLILLFVLGASLNVLVFSALVSRPIGVFAQESSSPVTSSKSVVNS